MQLEQLCNLDRLHINPHHQCRCAMIHVQPIIDLHVGDHWSKIEHAYTTCIYIYMPRERQRWYIYIHNRYNIDMVMQTSACQIYIHNLSVIPQWEASNLEVPSDPVTSCTKLQKHGSNGIKAARLERSICLCLSHWFSIGIERVKHAATARSERQRGQPPALFECIFNDLVLVMVMS